MTSSEPERRLYEAATSGDREAQGQLLESVRVRVCRAIERAVQILPVRDRRKLEVPDVWHETVLTAVEKLSAFEYRGEGSFGGWMIGIAKLKVLEMTKYRYVQKRSGGYQIASIDECKSSQALNILDELVSPVETPSRIVMGNEGNEILNAAISKLAEDERHHILSRLHGKSNNELAIELNITQNAARARTARVVKKLTTHIVSAEESMEWQE